MARKQAMTLQKAILKGCKLRPKQCFRAYFRSGKSDALGAAFEGLKGRVSTYDIEVEKILLSNIVIRDLLHDNFPELRYPVRACLEPRCLPDLRTVEELIVHLNDYHKWTRERIAASIAVLCTYYLEREKKDRVVRFEYYSGYGNAPRISRKGGKR